MLRVIISTTPDGNKEIVYFTDELKAPAEEFLRPGFELDSDTEIPDNLPPGFPIGYDLVRD